MVPCSLVGCLNKRRAWGPPGAKRHLSCRARQPDVAWRPDALRPLRLDALRTSHPPWRQCAPRRGVMIKPPAPAWSHSMRSSHSWHPTMDGVSLRFLDTDARGHQSAWLFTLVYVCLLGPRRHNRPRTTALPWTKKEPPTQGQAYIWNTTLVTYWRPS